jgi:hypothetical protein
MVVVVEVAAVMVSMPQVLQLHSHHRGHPVLAVVVKLLMPAVGTADQQ